MISIAYHSPLLSGGDGGGLFLFGTSFCVSPNSLLGKESGKKIPAFILSGTIKYYGVVVEGDVGTHNKLSTTISLSEIQPK